MLKFFVRLYARVFLGLIGSFYLPHYGVSVLIVKRIFPRFAWAQTFGDTILVREDLARFSSSGPRTFCETFAHELVHVEQYRRLGTIRFFLSYLLSSLRAFLSGRDYYMENELEREAYQLQSKYCEEHVKKHLEEVISEIEVVMMSSNGGKRS